MVVTLGDGGLDRLHARRAGGSSPIYPAKTGGDNVGAGDTLMAGILTWLRDHRRADAGEARRSSMRDQLTAMLWFGAVAAGINCSRVGANPPTRAEVDAVLAGSNRPCHRRQLSCPSYSALKI